MNTAPPLGLLTVHQAAELLQCSTNTVEQLIRSGKLVRVNVADRGCSRSDRGPKGWRIHPQDLAAFIDSRRRPEPQKPQEATELPRIVIPTATGTDGKSRLRRPRG